MERRENGMVLEPDNKITNSGEWRLDCAILASIHIFHNNSLSRSD